MARPLVLSNGRMHVGLNNFGLVHDFFYPYVGGDNYAAAAGLRHKIGVWVDGQYSWLDDGSWQFNFNYIEATLIGHTTVTNNNLGLVIEFTDAVLYDEDAFIRSIHLINARDYERDIRLFMHQVFVISESKRSDTIQYLPDEKALLHYKGRRYLVVGGSDGHDVFDDFAIGLHGMEGREGVYRDAEDGQLERNLVEHGSVDSILGFYKRVPAHESVHYNYWISAGVNLADAIDQHHDFMINGVDRHLTETSDSWHDWSASTQQAAQELPSQYRNQFINSAMLVKSHIDSRGGVVASTDTTMLNYSRDSYAYCWPRDGGYALWPLLRMGYTEELKRYFAFCERTMNRGGFLHHKYQPDGAIGSSWHPYTEYAGQTIPPLQEDETAITVFVFARYFAMHGDHELLGRYYKSMIKPMADFMANYVDPETKLPLPSYDLWERLFLTTTYTTALTYAALMEAVGLAEALGETDDAVVWRSVANEMFEARDIFYDDEMGSFIKGFIKRQDGSIEVDKTVDISSSYGAYMYGLWSPDSAEIKSSYNKARQVLKADDNHPAIARFANDEYNRFDASHVGNPWYIATLWLAQYDMETGNQEQARSVIDWVTSRMLTSGVLSEQFHPHTLATISVAPLTWSQAEYVNSLLDSVNHGDI